ncbi:DsbA family protein [Myxococcota bacterium]
MTLLRVSGLIAVAASVALAVDYASPAAAYCGQYGCAVVRQHGYLFGSLPMPWVGIAAYGAVYWLSLSRWVVGRQRVLPAVTILGGVVGAILFALQPLVIGAFCLPCVIVDAAAVLAGAAALGLWRSARAVEEAGIQLPQAAPSPGRARPLLWVAEEPLGRWVWFALLGLAVLGPLVWPQVSPAPALPAGFQAWVQPGKALVVEYSDYECPYCRLLHPRLVRMLSYYGDRVHYVKRNAPLAGHPHARDAAKAAVCAEQQGRGNEMVEALFSAPEVSAPTCRSIAEEMGLELAAFDRCLVSATTDARLRHERALIDAVGFQGLPTVFMGSRKLVGALPDEVLRKEIERALRPDTGIRIPAPLYVGLLVLAAAVMVVLGGPWRRRTGRRGGLTTTGPASLECAAGEGREARKPSV